MKCLLRYKWVKFPRNLLPPGKGIMGAWTRLASRAAFRNGQALYCGYINHVSAGEWAGGIVGLKSILGINRRQKALETLDKLTELGYINYTLDVRTKKLAYQVKDWVVECSGAPCQGREVVYATDGYGFLCLPRNITQRLAKAHYKFDESDAWLDLWCHTVYQEPGNAFSHMVPAIQFGKLGAVLTLETLGQRWGWEKTKVWRFFRKHADVFPLYKLPGSFGCLIFNAAYPTGSAVTLPEQAEVERILKEIRILGEKMYGRGVSGYKRLGKLVAWCSRFVITQRESTEMTGQSRVAPWDHNNTRAYFSSCRNCNHLHKDCQVGYIGARAKKFSQVLRQELDPAKVLEDSNMEHTKEFPCGKPPEQGPSPKAEEMLALLERRGIVENTEISSEKRRQMEQALRKNIYHNTQLMLKSYRDIVWALECFPERVAEELNVPLENLDRLLGIVDLRLALEDAKLEHKLLSIKKSRLLLDRVNDALTVLRQKPGNGEQMYSVIYQTFITPDKLSHANILYRLNLSDRHYYRLRQQAVNILSIRLWTAPTGCLDAWLEVLTLLEDI